MVAGFAGGGGVSSDAAVSDDAAGAAGAEGEGAGESAAPAAPAVSAPPASAAPGTPDPTQAAGPAWGTPSRASSPGTRSATGISAAAERRRRAAAEEATSQLVERRRAGDPSRDIWESSDPEGERKRLRGSPLGLVVMGIIFAVIFIIQATVDNSPSEPDISYPFPAVDYTPPPLDVPAVVREVTLASDVATSIDGQVGGARFVAGELAWIVPISDLPGVVKQVHVIDPATGLLLRAADIGQGLCADSLAGTTLFCLSDATATFAPSGGVVATPLQLQAVDTASEAVLSFPTSISAAQQVHLTYAGLLVFGSTGEQLLLTMIGFDGQTLWQHDLALLPGASSLVATEGGAPLRWFDLGGGRVVLVRESGAVLVDPALGPVTGAVQDCGNPANLGWAYACQTEGLGADGLKQLTVTNYDRNGAPLWATPGIGLLPTAPGATPSPVATQGEELALVDWETGAVVGTDTAEADLNRSVAAGTATATIVLEDRSVAQVLTPEGEVAWQHYGGIKAATSLLDADGVSVVVLQSATHLWVYDLATRQERARYANPGGEIVVVPSGLAFVDGDTVTWFALP